MTMECNVKILVTSFCELAVTASDCKEQKVTKRCILPSTDMQIMCREFEFGDA